MSRPQIHVTRAVVNPDLWDVSISRGPEGEPCPIFVGSWDQATATSVVLQACFDDAYDAGRTDTQALLVRPSKPADGYVWVAGHWREQCPPSRST